TMDNKNNHINYFIKGGGNVEIYVEETGNSKGVPLLFIHGLSFSHMAWKKQVESNALKIFRIITIDLRGHGFSGKSCNEYKNSKLWADDIQSIIYELNLLNPVLVGWSYGGRVIMDYLKIHGEDLISGMVFIGAGAGSNFI